MPTTVAEMFVAAGVAIDGVVSWRERIRCDDSGVYVVALTDDVDVCESLPAAPLSASAIRHLLEVRPELTVDGDRPTEGVLAARIAAFWLPDETIVYIGKATSLSSRVGSYYSTRLGAKRPHAGGWWLKVLEDEPMSELRVHYARVERPELAEDKMMEAFCDGVSRATRMTLHDPEHPFPFANLEWRTGGRRLLKLHGIRGATGNL